MHSLADGLDHLDHTLQRFWEAMRWEWGWNGPPWRCPPHRAEGCFLFTVSLLLFFPQNNNGGFFWKLPIKALGKVRNHFPGLRGGIFRTHRHIILVWIRLKILGKFWKKLKLGPVPTSLFFCSWTLAQGRHFKCHEMCAQEDRNHPLTLQ